MGLGPRPRPQRQGGEGPARPRHARDPDERPRGAPPRLEPEALAYFRRAQAALKETPPDGQERGLLVRNVLEEAGTQALALATDGAGSAVLQDLLAVSPAAPLCRLLTALRPHLRLVACHRSGAHVLQSALLQLPRLLGAPRPEEEEEEEEEEEHRSHEGLEELVLALGADVRDAFPLFSGDTHGSFVVRTLLQVLGGTVLESEGARPRGPQPRGRRAPARDSPPADFAAPDAFLSLLREMSAGFLEDIAVFVTHKVSSLCLQMALRVLSLKLPQDCARLCDAVVDYLSARDPSAEGSPLLLFLKDQTSSRLLERVLLVSEPPRLQRLFEEHFRGQLRALAAHPIANFPLQRLLDAITTPQLLSQVFEELSPALEAVLARGHVGVVTALLGACRRLGTHQPRALQLLLEAFHCAKPPSRRQACLPLFASLLSYEVYYELGEEETPSEHQAEAASARPLAEVTVPGSLLVQHLLHFSSPGPVAASLAALTGPQLLALARSPAGSHVLDALLASPTVTDKQRRRALRPLKGHYVALACSRHGSRVLDAIWSGAALRARQEIAAELGERERELLSDAFGHHVARNVALGHFLKRRQDWEKQQGAAAKRRRALSAVLGD